MVVNNISETESLNNSDDDDDEPPPLPPPRLDSLRRDFDAAPVKSLPTIPNSTSLTDFTYEESDSAEEVSDSFYTLPSFLLVTLISPSLLLFQCCFKPYQIFYKLLLFRCSLT